MKMTFYILASIMLVISSALFAFLTVWGVCTDAKTWDIVENAVMFLISVMCLFDAFNSIKEEDQKRRERRRYK